MKLAGWISILLCAAVHFSGEASAHGRSVSYSHWEIEGPDARVTLRLTLLELTRLRNRLGRSPSLDRDLADYLSSQLQLRADSETCAVVDVPRLLTASDGKVAFEWRIHCDAQMPTAIRSELFRDVAPAHLHFARLRHGDSATLERVLTEGNRSWPLAGGGPSPAPIPTGSSFSAYLALGVEHISTGYDHLVFLFALLLLASRLSEVVTIVTGFTLAHSITLGLAVFGGLRPEAIAVEALIGLSIVLVASENAWLLSGRRIVVPRLIGAALALMAALALAGVGSLPASIPAGLCIFALCYFGILKRVDRPVRFRVAISFVFGLVHGFGFAGVLEEISLSREKLATALFGFNLGVEVGQLVVVVALWPLLRAVAGWKHGALHRWAMEIGTGAVCAMGVFWLVSRTYG